MSIRREVDPPLAPCGSHHASETAGLTGARDAGWIRCLVRAGLGEDPHHTEPHCRIERDLEAGLDRQPPRPAHRRRWVELPQDLPPIRYTAFADPTGTLFRIFHNLE